jgi:hypothetical protein
LIDETRARTLQTNYLANRTDKSFEALRQEVQDIAIALIYCKIQKTGSFVDVLDKSYDASIHFMEMYLKRPDWKCKAFAFRIDCDVTKVLYNKKQRRYDAEINLQTNCKIIQQNNNDMYNFDINCDIIKEVERSNTFRMFIKRIAVFTDKEYIRRNVNKLNALYVNARGIK